MTRFTPPPKQLGSRHILEKAPQISQGRVLYLQLNVQHHTANGAKRRGFYPEKADPVLMKRVNSQRSEPACSRSARDSPSILAYFMSQSYSFRAGALSGQRWPSSWRAGATFIFGRWRLTMSYSGCVSTAQVAPWGVRLLLHPPGTSRASCWPRFGVNSISNSSAHPAPLFSCLVSCCIDHTLFTTTRHGRHASVFHPPPSCTRTYSPPEEQSERLDESREKSSLTFKWTPNGREASIVRSP